MSLNGSCHCGQVRIAVPRAPDWVASCNCSLCRKLAWLVAYYPRSEVRIEGETVPYVWGDRMIGIHHCPTCGCGTHWWGLEEALAGDLPPEVRSLLADRMGVNARMLDGFDPEQVEVRLMDNSD